MAALYNEKKIIFVNLTFEIIERNVADGTVILLRMGQ